MENENISCKRCGKKIKYIPHRLYCEDCKKKVQKECQERWFQQKYNENLKKTRYCVICGNQFTSHTERDTCSKKCRYELSSRSLSGHSQSKDTRDKIAKKNAYQWHLISPSGQHYVFTNLREWSRKNCELFGLEKNEENAKRILDGIVQAKIGNCEAYKKWRVVPDLDDWTKYVNDIVESYEYYGSMKEVSRRVGISEAKVKKLLITAGAFENEISVKVQSLHSAGKSISDISKILGIGKTTVNMYMPYKKGIYNTSSPTKNALKIRKCRAKKQNQEL